MTKPTLLSSGTGSRPWLRGIPVPGCSAAWNGTVPPTARQRNRSTSRGPSGAGTFTKSDKRAQFASHAHHYGGAVTPGRREQPSSWLQSIGATTGKEQRKRQWPTPLVAAVTPSSGGMLLTGDLDNNFLAIDASNGKTLYQFNTGGSVGAGVIAYQLKDKQYVATTSVVVSGFFGGSGTSAVILFALRDHASRQHHCRMPALCSRRMQLVTVAEHSRIVLSLMDDLRSGWNVRDHRGSRPAGEGRHRQRIADADRRVPGVRDRLFTWHVAAVAGLTRAER
jgi:PQQ enzyme-like repeat protein